MANKYTYRAPCTEAELRSCYESGMSQIEIAVKFTTTQKVIWTAMQKFGILARVAAKRNQRGSANSSWKQDPGYQALHIRVEVARGKPKHCEECGTSDPGKYYDWANLTGNYADVKDYKRMCRSCHHIFDKRINNIHRMRNRGAQCQQNI